MKRLFFLPFYVVCIFYLSFFFVSYTTATFQLTSAELF